jgi:hypothetical protein
MATSAQVSKYYADLREALVASYNEKENIKLLAEEADLDWGDVNTAGNARALWDDVLHNARKQRKVQPIIELAAKEYPLNDGLQLALVAFDSADEAIFEAPAFAGWPPLAYHQVDRIEQLDRLGLAVCDSRDRPLVAIWCGDELARHDILKSRIRELPLKVGGQSLHTVFRICPLGSDIHADLTRSCYQLVQSGKVPGNLQSLFVSKDFSRHLVTLVVDLVWDGQTCQQMEEILKWCLQVGQLAQDRRFVIAVAIEVRVTWRWLSYLGIDRRASAVKQAHEKLGSLLAKYDSTILLPALDDIELSDLRAWRADMEARHGTRDDDTFGDPTLSRIIQLKKTKPMERVVAELEKIFASFRA